MNDDSLVNSVRSIKQESGIEMNSSNHPKRRIAISLVVLLAIGIVAVFPQSSANALADNPMLISTPTAQWAWREVPDTDPDFILSSGVNDCDFLSGTDGWAVGEQLLHWNGDQWQVVAKPKVDSNGYPFENSFGDWLDRVSMATADDVWAVGQFGTIIHWDGMEWYDLPPVGNVEYFSIAVLPDNLGFIGGIQNDENEARAALKWDGEQWIPAYFPAKYPHRLTPPLEASGIIRDITLVSAEDGWAAGEGVLYRWDGKSWRAYLEQMDEFSYMGIERFSVINPDNIWAVGSITDHSVILHWNGIEWAEVYQPSLDNLIDIEMVSPNQGWAVSALPYLMEANSPVDSIIYTWDGTQWSETPIEDGVVLYTICASDQEHVWMIGRRGPEPFTPVVFRYEPLEESSPTATPTTIPPTEVIPTPTITEVAVTEVPTSTPSPTPMSENNPNQPAIGVVLSGAAFIMMIIALLLFAKKKA